MLPIRERTCTKTSSLQELNQEGGSQAIMLEMRSTTPTRLATNHLIILLLELPLVLDLS